MSLQTPTTKDINENIVAQLEASLNQTVPLLPKSFLRVLSKALAGVFILLYKYAGFMFLQQFVRTASIEPTEINGQTVRPLVEWGRLVGVGDPVPATQAELLIDITVNDQGGSLPSNSQLVGADNGVTYITIGSVVLDASTVQAAVRAVADQSGGGGAGTIGNLSPGAALSFANPLAQVARSATVVSQVVTGANAEAVEAYRQRILDRFQKRPQGGAYADYEQWGLAVAGVIGVWPYTGDPGEVDVYVEATVESSGNPDGIPTTAQLDAVSDAIELDGAGRATRRPAGAFVNVLPITRTGYDVTVSGLDVDDVAATQTDIEAALVDYFLSREPFILGLSTLPREDRIAATAVGGIVDDIVAARGGTFTAVTVERGGVPVTVDTLGAGEKAKLAPGEDPQ